MKTLAPLVLISLVIPTAAYGQVALGQVDDFQDGTVQGWAGGATPTNIATGGPSGAGDRYLQITSDGGPFAGGKLATHNSLQWAGNYTGAGVRRVSAFFRNFGSTDIHLRLVVFDFDLGQTRWTSNHAQVLEAGSGWRELVFSLEESDLTRVMGTASYATTLGGAERLMFRHQSGAPAAEGESIAAVLGIDRVTALGAPPEEVVPSSFSTIRGQVAGGNVASLGADDNDYLRHCKFLVPNLLVAPIEVQVNGTTTKASTTLVTAALTGKMANAGSFSHSVEQWNHVTAAYEDLATAAVGTGESTVTSSSATSGNHGDKIGAAGALRARYFVRRTGPSAVANFCYDADLFKWTVN